MTSEELTNGLTWGTLTGAGTGVLSTSTGGGFDFASSYTYFGCTPLCIETVIPGCERSKSFILNFSPASSVSSNLSEYTSKNLGKINIIYKENE